MQQDDISDSSVTTTDAEIANVQRTLDNMTARRNARIAAIGAGRFQSPASSNSSSSTDSVIHGEMAEEQQPQQRSDNMAVADMSVAHTNEATSASMPPVDELVDSHELRAQLDAIDNAVTVERTIQEQGYYRVAYVLPLEDENDEPTVTVHTVPAEGGEMCPICNEEFRPGVPKAVSIPDNEEVEDQRLVKGCTHMMCMGCAQQYLRNPITSQSLDVPNQVAKFGKCPLCRQFGIWKNDITGEILPDGKRVYGSHARVWQGRPAFLNHITDKNLYVALVWKHGKQELKLLEGVATLENDRRIKTLPITDPRAQQMNVVAERYIQSNRMTFTCGRCEGETLNTLRCEVGTCTCEPRYEMCTVCCNQLIEETSNDGTNRWIRRTEGWLNCPGCGTDGRCVNYTRLFLRSARQSSRQSRLRAASAARGDMQP
jgi:hypothetical protein